MREATDERSAPEMVLSPIGSGAMSTRTGAGGTAWPMAAATVLTSAPVTEASLLKSGGQASVPQASKGSVPT